MASYKQIVIDIVDYISFEIGRIEREMEYYKDKLPHVKAETLRVEAQTLKDISDIIKEGGK